MPLRGPNPFFNPSVEEESRENDEMDESNPNLPGYSDSGPGISWPELCAQHESILSSHLVMLNRLKSHINSDGEAFRVMSAMVDRTNKLMTQFKITKKRIIPRLGTHSSSGAQRGNDDEDSQAYSRSTSFRHGNSPIRSKDRRKRQRIDTDGMEPSSVEHTRDESSGPEAERVPKRKRYGMVIPGADEDARNALPVSLETEDISEEVQRRLKIKEEQRKKRHSKPEKRKRDSLASNGSTMSTEGATKPRKKAKIKSKSGSGKEKGNWED